MTIISRLCCDLLNRIIVQFEWQRLHPMFAACYSTISTFNAQVGVKHILFDTVYTNVVEAVAVDAQYRGGLGLVESRLEVE